ncbi:Nrap protein, domain 6, partial [Dillenia turbinata]
MEPDAHTAPLELKVRELLKEVQLDYSPSLTKFVDETISAIKESINRIPEGLKVNADVAPGFVRDIGADKVDFTFKKPVWIQIGGSYAIQCVAKPNVNVDILVQMPKECFHEKDYLNYRYHAKRFLYLCIIKKYLKLSSAISKVEWSAFENEARKPVLIVCPARTLPEVPGFFARIIPVATSLFNLSKLNLKRNNISALKQNGGNIPEATPKYNNSILEDIFLVDNVEYVKQTFADWKELREALILLKVWARQRCSIYAYDCLNGFLLSIILSYLATEYGQNRIKSPMTTVQIFRVTLDFIANSKIWDIGLYFQQVEGNSILIELAFCSSCMIMLQEKKQHLVEFREAFPVVICGPFPHFNLAFRMSRSAFAELRDEASLTLNCLTKYRDGGFEKIFMLKVDFAAKYDHCIRLKLKGLGEVCASGYCLDEECWRSYEQKVHSLLHQGLSDRAKSIRVVWRNTSSEHSMEDGFTMLDREVLLVGISLSSLEKAHRVVDIGPNADNKEEAVKFRKFWGEKAELRRFKDGKIAESTVWECKQWERHLIIKRISEYVLLRHLSIPRENMMHVADQLDFSLLLGVADPMSFSTSLLGAFEVLSKHLRSLNGIPLKISSVQPLDSAFRFTSVFPPEPHPLAYENGATPKLQKLLSTCIQPLEIMIQLEGSGNWPLDAVALEKTKSAFLLTIGESLQSSWGMTCSASEDNVVVFLSGYAFRLRILHERGLSLLKKQVANNQLKWVPSPDKKLFISSQHSSMINGLQGRYPIYGPIVRLAKRWVASHLFSASLIGEAIELLVAYLFLNPLPFGVPSSRITGFLRFLRLLSEYDWTFSALIVDLNEDLSSLDEMEINEKFDLSRKSYEENPENIRPAMFLATNYDKASEAWTVESPNPLELKRLVAYARSSANLLTKLMLEDEIGAYRWECLFRTPLSNFDAVVLLHKDKLPYPKRLLFPSELNQGRQVARGKASKIFHPLISPKDMRDNLENLRNKLLVDFDPLRCFLDDIEASKYAPALPTRAVLQKEFPKKFKVWYDHLGGDSIGLTWAAPCSKKRNREESTDGIENPVDILKSVGVVGKGIVRSVHFVKSPRIQ